VPPIILTLLQALFLLLLYVFVARAVRAVVRDVRASSQRAVAPAAPRMPAAPAEPAPRRPSRPAPPLPAAGPPARPKARRPRVRPSELVVHRSEGRPRVIPLDGAEVTFGRAADSTVVLDDPYASERHARVYREGDEWLIVDQGSTNGTLLNQTKVSAPTPIAAGDQVRIGKTVVEVRR
jgi:FHA domain